MTASHSLDQHSNTQLLLKLVARNSRYASKALSLAAAVLGNGKGKN